MAKLMTVYNAKEEIKRLQKFVDLVELYEADTLEKLMIKEYAYTISINQVVKILNERGCTVDGREIKKDELHRIERSGYFYKIKRKKIGR